MKIKTKINVLTFLALACFIFMLVFYRLYNGNLLQKDVYKRQQRTAARKVNDDAQPMRTERDSWLECMFQRNAHAKDYCFKHNKTAKGPRMGQFYLYEPKRLAYCEVPKVGCTFWKRIMRFINKDFPTNTTITKPSDISRNFTHLGVFKTTPRFKLGSNKEAKLRNMDNSFMFARDPYSRVWSAYLDKLFLPDFWTYIGINIVRAVRKNPNELSLKCGHDVTFQELMRYLVQHPGFEWHFKPINLICDPCRTKFKFIGKLESFVKDAKFIINETGMAPHVGIDIFNHTVDNEITMLSETYLNLKKKESVCNNRTLICERLWQVLQINGYIGFEITFPSHLSKIIDPNILVKEFIATAIKTHINGKSSHDIWKKQRRESLINAYRAIPEEIINTVFEVYKKDFEIFDYEKRPADIFLTSAK